MQSNFEYLKDNSDYASFIPACIEAEKLMNVSYSATATYVRRALELAVKWVYANDGELTMPYQDNLSSLIYHYDFKAIIDWDLLKHLTFIQQLGNKAVHTTQAVKREEAVLALRNLFAFVSWIDYCYSKEYEDRKFDESLLGDNDRISKSQQEKEDLMKVLDHKDRKLQELMDENKQLRMSNVEHRKANQQSRTYKVEEINEFATRKLYIDLMLELSGWEIGEDCLEEVETFSMDNASNHGFVDYVLYDDNGKPLAVVEAKKTSVNPRVGKVQAQMYADALEKDTGVRPVIFYTNGIEYFIWDDEASPERRISGIYSKRDLQKLIFKRNNGQSLKYPNINNEITNRTYQKDAITRTLETFEAGHRKALLVMATGSGKTRTAASIVDILTSRNFAKNILFLADRTALVKQAKASFNEYLPNLSQCNLLDSKDDKGSRMVFSTYPTMMNAIDSAKTDDGKRLFTNGHFDLIIVDESHRSIYKKYQSIFNYFDANIVGLTATPISDIDRNTYHFFDLEDNNPTFAYELDEAIKDGFLVPYGNITSTLKLIEDGVKYDDLSEEEKEAFDDYFDIPIDIPPEKLNKSLFNADTVDIVLRELMAKGIKVNNGDQLGKTIIFAANQKHADFIVERLDKLYPEYKGHFCMAIYNNVNYVENLIDKFKDPNSQLQIAVSVDMLDTGIDVPELVNLVFFKKVRSKAKFWQMIGRGTRLCKDLFAPGEDKKSFLIFDYYNNFEYFNVNKNGEESSNQRSLTENLFNIKVDIIKVLEHMDFQEDHYITYREHLIEDIVNQVNNINKKRFDAAMKMSDLDRYSDKKAFESLDEEDVRKLKDEISPLILSVYEDELAKGFDYLMYTIEYAYLEGRPMTRPKNKVITTAENLEAKGSIAQIKEQRDIIASVQTEEFWDGAGIEDFEIVRKALRDLIKLIDKKEQKIYYTNFKDEITEQGEYTGDFTVNDLGNYRKRVEHYLKQYQDDLTIHKLRHNKALTIEDIRYLEKVLWNDLGSKDEYKRTYGEMPMLKLVASIIGMDRAAAEAEFSQFLTDESLNSDQINFVKNVVEYIIKNGSLEKTVLQDYPFNINGGVAKIFETKRDVAKNIISIVDHINDRLTIDVG